MGVVKRGLLSALLLALPAAPLRGSPVDCDVGIGAAPRACADACGCCFDASACLCDGGAPASEPGAAQAAVLPGAQRAPDTLLFASGATSSLEPGPRADRATCALLSALSPEETAPARRRVLRL